MRGRKQHGGSTDNHTFPYPSGPPQDPHRTGATGKRKGASGPPQESGRALVSPPRGDGAYAPKAFDFPFTGLAPASRWAGTRSRAGSL